MPIARDSRGRFAGTREKVPVTSLQEAADTMRHFTQLMNTVAEEHRLCSQFGISVTRAVADTPGVEWDTLREPEFVGTWNIQGTVSTPTGARIVGPNADVRGSEARQLIDAEYEAWCRGHDLDHQRGTSWLAWLDTLPAERKTIGDGAVRRHGDTGLGTYFRATRDGHRLVTLAVGAPEATDPLPLGEASPAAVAAGVTPKAGPEPTEPAQPAIMDGDWMMLLQTCQERDANGRYGAAFRSERVWPMPVEIVRQARDHPGFYVVRRVSDGDPWGTQTVHVSHLRPAERVLVGGERRYTTAPEPF